MRLIKVGMSVIAIGAILGISYDQAMQRGWLGNERSAGEVQAPALPPEVIANRKAVQQTAGPGDGKQILFGDFHVHTTYSTDAFMWALPIYQGKGVHPAADACDYARYCSGIDFWSLTDHAEASTPARWAEAKRSVRQCQARAGDTDTPDLVSFLGFEWSQIGRLPEEHFGHKNVIFKDLSDKDVAARPIAASGLPVQALRTQAQGLSSKLPFADWKNRQDYFDFNTFLANIRHTPDCDPSKPSSELPANCFEQAATPGDLIARLEDQGLDPLIIPHGSSWGFYTPPATTWDKSLAPEHRPEEFQVIEIYSGHGNSEEYRPWRAAGWDANTSVATCPAPSANYIPSCWQAGEIVRKQCQTLGETSAECDARAVQARDDYANMGVAGHIAVYGETPEDWLEAGQCTDCFLPPFNHRPGNSVQYGLAISRFAENPDHPTRFNWGFIGSSDNHRARPGTGYKEVARRLNTEAGGPKSERWLSLIFGEPQKPDGRSHRLSRQELTQLAGFQLTEMERQSSFWQTGGLAAVHADNRSRDAIWDAFQRKEIYATSGPRILLWFDEVNRTTGERMPMGATYESDSNPTFEVRALGAFKQKPGCPGYAVDAMGEERINTICAGECYNPSDERHAITRIEIVRIRPQASPGEDVSKLIDDPFLVHDCPKGEDACTFSFEDPSFHESGRDTLYYVRAIQEATPTINAEPVQCERNSDGECIKAKLCYGDYRSGASECLSLAEHRAWSSPIYVNYRKQPMDGAGGR